MRGDDRPEEARVEAALAQTEPDPDRWLESIYRDHSAAVLQSAYRVTGNRADAEDALQTVFIRLARRAEPPDFSRGAAGYLRRAATNAALDIVQSRAARTSAPLTDHRSGAADAAPGPERLHHSAQIKNEVRRVLAHISRRQAEVFILRYFEGLDNTEIAAVCDTTPGTVAVTLHRVRARLMTELAPFLGGIHDRP
jgi:RNA polymerase sigma-70 factor (ECF subfamily)